MKVLVTGGSGYIGSELMKVLYQAGHEPINYDIAANPVDDVRDASRVDVAVSSVDIVYHLASPCILQDSIRNPWKYWDHIVRGTSNVAESCGKHEKRLVWTSTQLTSDAFRCSCCGQFQSPYAAAKREAEKIVEVLTNSLTVRLPNVYDLEGRDSNESRLFPRLNKQARESGVVRIYPPEDTPVTLVEVGQCAKSLLSYLRDGRGVITMEGEKLTIRQVADRVAAIHGARVEVVP